MSFYGKLIKDDIVGPFFIAKLGDDMSSEQWLKLFSETLDEVYIAPIAEKFKERAMIIAGNFMRNLRIA